MISPKSLALGPKCVLYLMSRVSLKESRDGGVQCRSGSSESAEKQKPKCLLLVKQEILPGMDGPVLSLLPPARGTGMFCKALSEPQDATNIRSRGDGRGQLAQGLNPL